MNGRLEYVDGRLLYMPPCGDRQASGDTLPQHEELPGLTLNVAEVFARLE